MNDLNQNSNKVIQSILSCIQPSSIYILKLTKNLLYRLQFSINQNLSSLKAVVCWKNGYPVETKKIAANMFLSLMNKYSTQTHFGIYSYDTETQNIEYFFQVAIQPSTHTEYFKLALEELIDEVPKLLKTLQIIGIVNLNPSQRLKFKLKQAQQKAIQQICEILKKKVKPNILEQQKQKKQQEQQTNNESSVFVQVKNISQLQISTNNTAIAQGGYFDIKKVNVQITHKDQTIQKIQVASKRIKATKQRNTIYHFEEKIEKQQQILAKVDNNKYFIKYYKNVDCRVNDIVYMEYLPNTLQNTLNSCLELNMENVLSLMKQVIESTQSLHSFGIVHRDLKPSNYLVSTYNQEYKLKVIDFGQSALIETIMNENQPVILGYTLPYSPIQCTQKGNLGYNHLTIDLWSVGVLTFKLILSRVPIKYSKCFAADILKGWPEQFSLFLRKYSKSGLMFIQDIFHLLAFLMIKIKPANRLPLHQAKSIINVAQKYLHNITAIALQ